LTSNPVIHANLGDQRRIDTAQFFHDHPGRLTTQLRGWGFNAHHD
jgi:hypothetical protein